MSGLHIGQQALCLARHLVKEKHVVQQLKVWEASLRIPSNNGNQIIVTRVMAADSYKARLLFEAQYGRGCLVNNPRMVN